MMAFALYIVLEPRECDDKGLDVQRLASFLHRTPSSVALKIWNIAAYDDNRKARGRVGMKHGSKLDSQVWQWYAEDPDAFMEQCLDLLRHALLQADANDFNPVPLASDRIFSLESATFLLIAERAPAGEERPTTTLQRVNQSYYPLTNAELPQHLLHHRSAASHTADRQPHQTLEGSDPH